MPDHFEGFGYEVGVRAREIADQQTQAARCSGGVDSGGLGAAADGADGVTDQIWIVAGGEVPQFGEDEASYVRRRVREVDGEQFEFETGDMGGFSGAEEEMRGVSDELVRMEEADLDYVIEGKLLDVLR